MDRTTSYTWMSYARDVPAPSRTNWCLPRFVFLSRRKWSITGHIYEWMVIEWRWCVVGIAFCYPGSLHEPQELFKQLGLKRHYWNREVLFRAKACQRTPLKAFVLLRGDQINNTLIHIFCEQCTPVYDHIPCCSLVFVVDVVCTSLQQAHVITNPYGIVYIL
jgi:hypothetical protein